jgi:hypothetical protein
MIYCHDSECVLLIGGKSFYNYYQHRYLISVRYILLLVVHTYTICIYIVITLAIQPICTILNSSYFDMLSPYSYNNNGIDNNNSINDLLSCTELCNIWYVRLGYISSTSTIHH